MLELMFLSLGFLIGFGAHAILLQIAYRLGIVEFKGAAHD